MMKVAMSPAALGLLRELMCRAGVARDRILLTEWRSTDWQSLTFVGERHELQLRISGANSMEVAKRLVAGLEDAELSVSGHVVADIAAIEHSKPTSDGSTLINIEALTIVD